MSASLTAGLSREPCIPQVTATALPFFAAAVVDSLSLHRWASQLVQSQALGQLKDPVHPCRGQSLQSPLQGFRVQKHSGAGERGRPGGNPHAA
mmetsp:Transcript_12581/g.29791  ORF Transcript_12581/g.29791 Transcript_12581/m.29791 type:complete len:93 (-) Transcript_12581:220-498(-)